MSTNDEEGQPLQRPFGNADAELSQELADAGLEVHPNDDVNETRLIYDGTVGPSLEALIEHAKKL